MLEKYLKYSRIFQKYSRIFHIGIAIILVTLVLRITIVIQLILQL